VTAARQSRPFGVGFEDRVGEGGHERRPCGAWWLPAPRLRVARRAEGCHPASWARASLRARDQFVLGRYRGPLDQRRRGWSSRLADRCQGRSAGDADRDCSLRGRGIVCPLLRGPEQGQLHDVRDRCAGAGRWSARGVNLPRDGGRRAGYPYPARSLMSGRTR
jgi:hypothetical protein